MERHLAAMLVKQRPPPFHVGIFDLARFSKIVRRCTLRSTRASARYSQAASISSV